MPTPESSVESGHPSFRTVLVRVLVVQAIALAALWFLQSRYGG